MEREMKDLQLRDMTQFILTSSLKDLMLRVKYSTPSAFFIFYCLATLNHRGCDATLRTHANQVELQRLAN